MNMIFIRLKNSTETATIDQDDDDRVSAHTWRISRKHNKLVPVTRIDGKEFRLNRLIMGCTPNDGYFVEHVNGDHLDCRKANLRRVKAPFDPSRSWDKRRKVAAEQCHHRTITQNGFATYECAQCGTPCHVTFVSAGLGEDWE